MRFACPFALVFLLAAHEDPAGLLKQAELHLDQGRYAAAQSTAQRAAAGFEKARDLKSRARALTTAGLAQMYSGEYQVALSNFEIALQYASSVKDFGNEVGRLNDIGNAYYFQGLYSEAMGRYQQAMRRVADTPSDQWSAWGRQITTANIAILYQTLGQSDRALTLYTELLSGSQSLPPREQAQFLTNVGVLRRRLGDPRKALDTYREAQALYRKAAHRDGEIAVLNNIGIVQAMDLHDWKAAETTFTRAYELAVRSGDRPLAVHARLYRGETLYRAGRMSESESDFQTAAEQAKELGEKEEQWKALFGVARVADRGGERRRSVGLLDKAITLIEALRANSGAPPSLSGFLADKRAVYDLRIVNSVTADEAFRWIEASRARSLVDRKGIRSRPSLAELAASLPLDTAVVEYWVGGDACAVIWATRSSVGIRRWPMSPKKRDVLEGIQSALADPNVADWRLKAQSVSEELLSGIPVLHIPGIAHLIIVPDGLLTRIPFEALPFGDDLLIQRFTVSYMPSATLIHWPDDKSRWRWPWQLAFSAFADPSPGNGASVSGIATTRTWPRLPEAQREVAGVAGLSGGKSFLKVGPAARKDEMQAAVNAPVLHFATHGFADAQNPDLSYLLLAPAVGSGQQYDYLFLREAYRLALSKVELVTLSACETDAGPYLAGEGVQGFSQAFLAAGARTVVTSLWRVGDLPAAELMLNFYRRLWERTSVAEALRGAKLEFLAHSASAHPAHWAAFIVEGDPGLRMPVVIRWSWMALVGILAAGIGLVWYKS